MKGAYPVIMERDADFIMVYVPDFSINTEGRDLADAMEMARDAIGLVGIDMEDAGEAIPTPSAIGDISTKRAGEFVTLVDVDFCEYRRKRNMTSVRKNCTIPSWLNEEAEKAGLNFSAILQKGLQNELHISQME